MDSFEGELALADSEGRAGGKVGSLSLRIRAPFTYYYRDYMENADYRPSRTTMIFQHFLWGLRCESCPQTTIDSGERGFFKEL